MPEPQQNLKMIKEIFGDYKTRANIIEAKVLGLNLIKKKRILEMVIESDEYIEIKELWYFEKYLRERFLFENIELEMSLDVALDIIGTLRMMKIDELSKETDPIKIEILEKEFNVLTIEERIAQGLEQFEGWKDVRLSVMDKIQNYYAPKLRAYYAAQ